MLIHKRHTFKLFQAAVAILAIIAIAVLGFLPLDFGEPVARPTRTGKIAASASNKLQPVSQFAVIYQRDLRRPLIDAVITPPPPPPPKKLTISLVGTAVDPGYTCALFRLANGQIHTVSVGEKIEDATVTEIIEGGATVQFAGQTIKLTVEKGDKKDGTP